MTVPTVNDADTTTGTQSSASTSWTITYPANIVAGDLLIFFFATNTDGTDAVASGWSSAFPGNFRGGVLKKKATGSESGTFTATMENSTTGHWVVYRISGWDGSIGSGWGYTSLASQCVVANNQGGNSTTPDPPSITTIGWGSGEDTLVIAAVFTNANVTVDAFPSGFGNSYSANDANGGTIGIARKTSTGPTEDPGTFTISSAVSHNTLTILIRGLFGPTIHHADTTNASQSSNSNSWTLTYPSNLQAGDLILAFLAIDGNTSGTWPAGWLRNGQSPGAVTLEFAKKLSDGTETGNFSLPLGASEQGAWRIIRISNWEGTLGTTYAAGFTSTGSVECAAGSGGSPSANPDPQSLDPTNWASEDTLWLAVAAVDTSRTFSAWPSGYSPGNGTADTVSGGSTGASLSVQYKRATASSEDPGTFTISASDDWSAATAAIRPAAPAAPATLLLQQGFVNHGATAVYARAREAWERRRSGLLTPRLWTPEGAQI